MLRQFLAELRRRRVVRAVVGFGVFALTAIQVAEPLMHALHLPDWTLSALVVLLATGFPAVVVLAWVFDLRASGLERTGVVTGAAPLGRLRGGRLVLLLVGLGVAVAVPGLAWHFLARGRRPAAVAGEATSGGAVASSVAVLPFADLSPQRDQEYLSDGIAEEILNALARVPGLKVAGRTSSFSFKGKAEDAAAIAGRLHVAHLLEGSVRKEGSRVRISAKLLDARDGFQVWAQSFDRELTGVLSVQEEIATAVVNALGPRLLAQAGPAPAPGRRAADPEVYDHYLLGREYLRRGHVEKNLRRAAEAFERALALDPAFAPAWAGLSHAAGFLADYEPSAAAVADEERRALAAAEKALALDPRLAEGYVERAHMRQVVAWDFAGAGRDLERALALRPGDAQIHRALGLHRAALGRLPESVAHLRQALELDPLEGASWLRLAFVHVALGDLESARAELGHARELLPDSAFVLYESGVAALLGGDAAGALRLFERSQDPWRTTGVALAAHRAGDDARARAALEDLTRRLGHSSAYQIAQVHADRGERDAAFAWLERAFEQHDGGLLDVKCDVLLAPLRGDPRFPALLRRMNLTPD